MTTIRHSRRPIDVPSPAETVEQIYRRVWAGLQLLDLLFDDPVSDDERIAGPRLILQDALDCLQSLELRLRDIDGT